MNEAIEEARAHPWRVLGEALVLLLMVVAGCAWLVIGAAW